MHPKVTPYWYENLKAKADPLPAPPRPPRRPDDWDIFENELGGNDPFNKPEWRKGTSLEEISPAGQALEHQSDYFGQP